MKHSVTVILVFLVCTGLAEARLGESRKQCDSRYGKPMTTRETDDKAMGVYRKSSFEVAVEFTKRKILFRRRYSACKVVYRKPLASGDGSLPFTEGELNTLLGANASKMRWSEVDMYIEAARTSDVDKRVRLLRDAENFTIWMREDGAQAVHDRRQHTLTVRSQSSSGHKTLGTESDLSGF
ncbi:MAG: hypothetical protein ISS35_01190 [Kiritimatiellae bacterium]|nr:hypothetical protein [Kiritimatiellia bacterium]